MLQTAIFNDFWIRLLHAWKKLSKVWKYLWQRDPTCYNSLPHTNCKLVFFMYCYDISTYRDGFFNYKYTLIILANLRICFLLVAWNHTRYFQLSKHLWIAKFGLLDTHTSYAIFMLAYILSKLLIRIFHETNPK